MDKKYQVFISSTYSDLKEERFAVSQTLLELGCIPVGMEQFPASGMSQMEYIEKMLDTCDYYILISAGRYGSLDPTDGIGYTEKEYDYAVSKGMPVLSFLLSDIDGLEDGKREITDAGKSKIYAFREKITASRLVRFYTSKEDLQAKVAVSLQRCIIDFPAIGWVRADSIDVDSNLEERFQQYLKEHTLTAEEVDMILNESDDDDEKLKRVPTIAKADVMLLYAAENNGKIEVSRSVVGSTYLAGGKYNMNSSQDQREIASWDAAVEHLLDEKDIKVIQKKGAVTFYAVTNRGFNVAVGFKEANKIDPKMDPIKVLKMFAE